MGDLLLELSATAKTVHFENHDMCFHPLVGVAMGTSATGSAMHPVLRQVSRKVQEFTQC